MEQKQVQSLKQECRVYQYLDSLRDYRRLSVGQSRDRSDRHVMAVVSHRSDVEFVVHHHMMCCTLTTRSTLPSCRQLHHVTTAAAALRLFTL